MSTELFILAKLFGLGASADVSWWWLALFLLMDTFTWDCLRRIWSKT